MPGTLGFIAREGPDSLWIVSCYHVLIRPPRSRAPTAQGGEPIYQPGPIAPNTVPGDDELIAHSDPARANRELDCAAAALEPTIEVDEEILGIGIPASKPIKATRKMKLIKFGATTGVTRGVVTQIRGTTVRIEPRPEDPPRTLISDFGDSGALWLEEDTLAPVALHRRGNTARAFALGSDIITVLNTLSLQFLKQ